MKQSEYQWPANIISPVCPIKPFSLKAFGDERTDNYYWLNDFFKKGPDSDKTIEYIKAENEYYELMMAETLPLQEELYGEMKARVQEKDESVPYFKKGYYYYSRQVEAKDYYIFCRKPGSLNAEEEILLDVNAMAEGHTYYAATGFSLSMDNKLLAYGVDTLSRREYTIYIKNLETGETLQDAITDTEGDPVWANDNRTIFYTAKNPVTLLSEKIKKHILGTAAGEDAIVYEEKEVENYIGVSKTKSDQYILITSQATLSSEIKWIAADKPDDVFAIFQPRIKDVLYEVDHANDLFYIRTNLNAKNFKIITCREDKKEAENWIDIVSHQEDTLIQRFELFRNYLVVAERKNGLTQIHIIQLKSNTSHYLAFDEPAYTASIGNNPNYDTETLRFNYTSLVTPVSVFDYNMVNKEKLLMKQQIVLGEFKTSDYTSERFFITATDGTQVPVSIVYKNGFKRW